MHTQNNLNTVPSSPVLKLCYFKQIRRDHNDVRSYAANDNGNFSYLELAIIAKKNGWLRDPIGIVKEQKSTKLLLGKGSQHGGEIAKNLREIFCHSMGFLKLV